MSYEKIDVCMIELGKGQVFVDRELFNLLLSYSSEDRRIFSRWLIPFIGNTPSNPISLQRVSPIFAKYKEEKKNMSRMQELLTQQQELLTQQQEMRKELRAMANTRFAKDLLLGSTLGEVLGKLDNIQEHLTSHRVASENGETPKTPPVPKRMAAYMVEFMQEPVEVRHRIYHFAKAKRLEVPDMEQTPQYEELIEKYDVPEFLELLQEIPFRAIV